MKTVQFKVDGVSYQTPLGLTAVSVVLAIADCIGKGLFLSREDDIDIPLRPNEHLVIRGGEEFVTGSSSIENNPPVRNEISPEFNGSRNISLSVAKIQGNKLRDYDVKFPNGRLFVDIDGGVDAEIRDDMTIVIQDSDSYFVIPPNKDGDDAIDVEECSQHDRKPPHTRKYRIRVDGENTSWRALRSRATSFFT